MQVNHDFSPRLSAFLRKNYFYLYENGKFIRLYLSGRSYNSMETIRDFAHACKIPQDVKVEGYDKIQNPQEWDNGKLKFKVMNLEHPDYTEGNPACLSIELLNWPLKKFLKN